jgi:hypothetical protein
MKDKLDILLMVTELKLHWLKLTIMDANIKIEKLILKYKRKRYKKIMKMYKERISWHTPRPSLTLRGWDEFAVDSIKIRKSYGGKS